MPGIKKLSRQEEAYCQLRAQGENQSDSYRGAYNTSKMKISTVHRKAAHVEERPKIQSRIAELLKPALEKNAITVESILAEIKEIVFSDIRELYNENGTMKPVKDWPDGIAKAVCSVKTVESSRSNDDDPVFEFTKEVKLWSKDAALEKLFKYLGMYERDNKQRGAESLMKMLMDAGNTGLPSEPETD